MAKRLKTITAGRLVVVGCYTIPSPRSSPEERKALRDRARGIAPPDKLTKTQKKIWTYMKFHPDVTSYRAIARGAGVTRHTAAKWYEKIRGMLGRTPT